MPTVFPSSTSRDLRACRDAVLEACRALHLAVATMEDFPATGLGATAGCRPSSTWACCHGNDQADDEQNAAELLHRSGVPHGLVSHESISDILSMRAEETLYAP